MSQGGVLPLQANFIPSNKFLDLTLTGSMGDVMKESVHCSLTAAIDYIRRNLNKYTNITQKTNTTPPNAKYDSTILQSIISNSSDVNKNSNMIEFIFTSNSTTN